MSNNHPSAHIYTLSRLVLSPAAGWEKQIAAIEAGRKLASKYYLPLREAVVKFCAADGQGADEIIKELRRRAEQMTNLVAAVNNESAFVSFTTQFYPKMGTFKKSHLQEVQDEVILEGLGLRGTPHFSVLDQKGETRYVFLYASKWKPTELSSYLHLLTTIIEGRYGATADQLWCMDLRAGETTKFKKGIRLSSQCAAAARHYVRLAPHLTPK